MLIVLIAYKTRGIESPRSECIVRCPSTRGEADEAFNFFWMLYKSDLVAEFQVRNTDGSVIMPSNFGWACGKWVEKVKYQQDPLP